jgi:HAE1 family hydrophobic/amphiphilic exporter-1
MKLSVIAVQRPVATLMVFLALILLGGISYQMLPLQLIPDITVPGMGVYVNKPGSSAQEIVEELTKPVEGVIAELPRVKAIRSWTGNWGSWIQAEFETGTDIRFTTLDLQERLTSFQAGLSDRRSVIDVVPFSTDNFKNFLMEVSLEGPDEQQLQELMKRTVEPALKSIAGVAQVEVGGLIADSAEVEIDPDRLAGFGLEFGQVFNRIQSAGAEDTFLGSLKVPGETHYVRLENRVRNTDELRRLHVDSAGIVTLEDVAIVREGLATSGSIYRSNGYIAVGANLQREEGENLVRVARTVREVVADLQLRLPPGTNIRIETDIAEMVEDALAEVRNLALIGACLALLVPLVFFRSWRISFIIFISVPICILAVFNLFAVFNMSINIFSIIGLALAVGMLVDNSIVVVENCFRLYFTKRLDAITSASLGGDEVGRALLASTLTSCVPFIPFAFLDSDFAMIIREPALALVFPLLLSLLVALTLSAMLTGQALRTVGRETKSHRRLRGGIDPRGSRLREAYRFILKAALRHRGRVLLVIAAILAFVFLEACNAVNEAATDRSQQRDSFRFYLIMPSGSKTSETSETMHVVEERLREHPDIRRFGAWISGESANIMVELHKPRERPTKRSLKQIQGSIVEFVGDVPGAEVSLTRPDNPMEERSLPAGDRGLITLKAIDTRVIEEYAGRLAQAIETHSGVTKAGLVEDRSQAVYDALIDRDRSSQLGINAQTLGQYVGITRASGQISSLVLKDGERRTDVAIVVKGAAEDNTLANVRDLPIYTPTGTTVPFAELTRMRAGQLPGGLARTDRQSSLDLEYFWSPGTDQGQLLRFVKQAIERVPNPARVQIEFGGAQMQIDQQQADFQFVLLAAVILIYVVMAAVFESFWIPLTIIMTNPLMIIGIVLALAVTGLPFDELAAFGVILLNGLAVNNGIVLMDTVLRYQRDQGFRRIRAVFQAADQRLRPILMTFLTTTLGLMPLAISGDEGSQWRPVAVTVVGGLTSATLLTLIVLPCFYMIGDDFVRWLWPIAARFMSWIGLTAEAIANRAALLAGTPLGIWSRGFRIELWRTLRADLLAFWHGIRWILSVGWRFPLGLILFLVRLPLRFFGDLVVIFRAMGGFAPKTPLAVVPDADLPTLTRSGPGSGDSEPLVRISNLHVTFPAGGMRALRRYIPRRNTPIGHGPIEGYTALDGITLDIGSGLYGLLGPNGAGKTTLMRCLSGLLQPTRGTVSLYGVPHRIGGESLAPLVGYLPQVHGHTEWMTLEEYLDYFATWTARTVMRARRFDSGEGMLGARLESLSHLADPRLRRAAILRAVEEVHLEHVLRERVGTFSGGMKQRAGIARVLVAAPPIVLVDEPTAGLDPVERVSVRLLLARLAQTRTVIFSTHLVEDLEDSCVAVGILQRGRLLFSGPPRELQRRWDGQVWEIPAEAGADAEQAFASSTSPARLLFRFARAGSEGWRVLCAAAPHPTARRDRVTLEDALLATLGAGQ